MIACAMRLENASVGYHVIGIEQRAARPTEMTSFKMPPAMERDGFKIIHRTGDDTYHWVQDHHGSYHQGKGDHPTPQAAFDELWDEVKDVFGPLV